MPLDLTTLNDPQRQAVLTTEGPLYVIAGPGSGKTRVLTHRVAHLVSDLGVDPAEIVAITFTNKAAREMRERVEALTEGLDIGRMWVLTFHSMCLRMLKRSGRDIGLDRFTVYDDHDSKALFGALVDDLDLKEHKNANRFRSLVSNLKNDLVGPESVVAEMGSEDPETDWATVAQVYEGYQRRLREVRALDFDDLLFETHRLLSTSRSAREGYRDRFRYLMVDEHQDTNKAQYAIIRLLANASQNVMVVFDDDQGIYGWRGADVRNVRNFMRDFQGAKGITLGQNYRSTTTIVGAASAMIAHNRQRQPKTLFSEGKQGDLIRVHSARDEKEEATFVVQEIARTLRSKPGWKHSDVAILYRTSAQSRAFESVLLRASMPYTIVKGTAFFDRAEVKDAVSALRVAVNPEDDVGLTRMLTSTHAPKRGIGKDTLRKIADEAGSLGISLDEGLRQASLYGWSFVATKTLKAIGPFVNVVDEMRRIAADDQADLATVVRRVLERSGLFEALQGGEEGEDRATNVRELSSLAAEFSSSRGPEETATLDDFLEWLALQGGEMLGGGRKRISSEDGRDAVRLMTAHASKGLEFRMVVVVGMEEEYFPHMRATMDLARRDEAIAEERRLAYVAMTRAKEVLYLTMAEERVLAGRYLARRPSRFLDEIPAKFVTRTGTKPAPRRPNTGWSPRR